MFLGCEQTDDRWRYMRPIMLLFSAVVYLYWRICAVCLPAPLLPRPLSSWPSLSRPSPHPLPGICLPLLLLQQCGVLCLMLCRLWRECCHDNVEVVYCMELFTGCPLPLRTCKVWCVSCRARLLAWWGSIADNVQSNIKGVTRCLASQFTWRDWMPTPGGGVRPLPPATEAFNPWPVVVPYSAHLPSWFEALLLWHIWGVGLLPFGTLVFVPLLPGFGQSKRMQLERGSRCIFWCHSLVFPSLRRAAAQLLSQWGKEMVVAGFAVSTQVLDEPELIH